MLCGIPVLPAVFAAFAAQSGPAVTRIIEYGRKRSSVLPAFHWNMSHYGRQQKPKPIKQAAKSR